MNRLSAVIMVISVITLSSCAKYYNYTFRLDEPTPVKPLYYENDTMTISFRFKPESVGFTIQNKLADGIKINWDEVSLSIARKTFRVIHKETGLAKTTDLQPPTTIPPRSQLTDIIVPSDKVKLSRMESNVTWIISNTFPNYGSKKEGQRIMRRKGDNVVLFLPFRIADKYVSNTFYFTIEDIQASKKREF